MPTRFVTLMNPRPRRAARRVRRSRMQRNRSGRFMRRAHSNPRPRRRRSRIIYRAAARRVYRRRRVHRNPPKMTPAMRRKVGLGVRRANRLRTSRGSIVRRATGAVSRRFRRRGDVSRGGFGSGGGIMRGFRSALSRPLLMKAGGAVAASFGTGWILNRWGATLPFSQNQYGRILYTLGIPVLGAILVRRQSRDLAEGLVIGGLVMTINTLMQGFRTAALATPAPARVGDYAVAGELGTGTFGYYPQGMSDASGLGGANVAFPVSAWGQ